MNNAAAVPAECARCGGRRVATFSPLASWRAAPAGYSHRAPLAAQANLSQAGYPREKSGSETEIPWILRRIPATTKERSLKPRSSGSFPSRKEEIPALCSYSHTNSTNQDSIIFLTNPIFSQTPVLSLRETPPRVSHWLGAVNIYIFMTFLTAFVACERSYWSIETSFRAL